MKKQTAVEWLLEQISVKNGYIIFSPSNIDWDGLNEIFEQAKAMEKEQIIETWHNGYNNQSPMIDEENCGQQYYNETYKGGEE